MADERCGGGSRKWHWLAIIAVVIVILILGYHYKKSRGKITEIPAIGSNVTGSGHTIEESHLNLKRREIMPENENITEPGKHAAQEGIKLYAEEKYEEAKEFLERAAEEGNTDAKALLGKMHVLGHGGAQDVKKGLDYLEDAAERGSAYAMAELGEFYVLGKHGVEKATDKGLALIRKSIDTGGYYGHLAMSRLYAAGEGVEHSVEKATEHVEEAGKRGYKHVLEEVEKIKAKI